MENLIFKNENFGEIRVAGTSEEPMFCLADICRVLELRVDGVIPRLREGGYNRIVVTDSLGRKQNTYFVNEQNLYKVIMRSDKPNHFKTGCVVKSYRLFVNMVLMPLRIR